MVLQNFSWQQFAVFVSVAAAAWYLVVYLLYFRRLPGGGSGAGVGTGRTELDEDSDWGGASAGDASESSLMGASREDPGVGSMGMHELEFSGVEDLPEVSADSPFDDPEPGSLELLTSQLKDSVAGFSEAGENSRPALLATLAGILREYPDLLQSDMLEPVLLLLCDYAEDAELPYSITPEQIRAELEL